ncbi:MAG: chemotaxis protein CheW [Phycisphaerales bacterium]|jgi:purine-binding chemotaxis protein CheW
MSEMAIQTEQSHKAMLEKEGKYLTFALANEEYGLEILKVREIIGYMEITAVPQTPAYVKGVINLRGQVIPVVDLRAKFGMETSDITDETCIIVVETSQNNHNFSTGIVVDHVEEVLDIAGEDIEEAPQFGSAVNTDFILGMGKIGDNVKILLDIDRVLDGEDFVSYTSGQASAPVRRGSKKEISASVEQAKSEQTQQEQPQAESAEPEQAQQEEPQTE